MSDSPTPAPVVTALGRGRYLIERGASRRLAYAARVAGATWVWLDGQVAIVGDGVGHEASHEAGRPAGDGLADLSAPMPATVVSVDVQPGQSVSRGDTLVRLEAMKMEWPLVAPRDGVVAAVRCRTGELVQPGVPLVEFA